MFGHMKLSVPKDHPENATGTHKQKTFLLDSEGQGHRLKAAAKARGVHAKAHPYLPDDVVNANEAMADLQSMLDGSGDGQGWDTPDSIDDDME